MNATYWKTQSVILKTAITSVSFPNLSFQKKPAITLFFLQNTGLILFKHELN